MAKPHLFVVSLLQALVYSMAQPFVGVNYGQVADNLPPVSATVSLLQSTTISNVRLYNVDPVVLRAFAGTNISIVVCAANSDIPSLASSPSAASQWFASNLAPFLPATKVSIVSVGNEVLNYGDPSLYPQLLPAMQNLQQALPPGSGIRVSTVHSMAVLSASDPPSAGALHADLAPYMNPTLQFLADNSGPFMINPYPYFAYRDDPRPDTLAYCLFQPNPGRTDANTKLTYTNMFDAQVDAIKSALNSAEFGTVEILVAETGWPYNGDPDEVGATVENAAAYNGNLVKHLKSMVGTPLMPGKSVETYIFALYDEDLKPGPTSERSFGLFRTDSTAIYDAGLTATGGGSTGLVPSPVTPLPLPPPASVNPSQPQPAVNCLLTQTAPDCRSSSSSTAIPSSAGLPTVNFIGSTLGLLFHASLLPLLLRT